MKLSELVRVSLAVAGSAGRLDKVAKLAALLQQLRGDELQIAIGFLTGWPRQGKLGIGWAALASAREASSVTEGTLELGDVDTAFTALQSVKGKKSAAEKLRLLKDLLGRATTDEQEFLSALALGGVRQGALEGVMADAVAKATGASAAAVRRAAMLAGDLGMVARALSVDGLSALDAFKVQLFRPVQPMLADSADSVADALREMGGRAAVEWKLDGARIQVHREGDRVAVYTRNLNDVTAAVPEVVEATLALTAREVILDGEVIALRADGQPLSFQTTMRRFGRRLDIDTLRAELPLTPFFFDMLRHDGTDVMDQPLSERLVMLEQLVPAASRVARITTSDGNAATAFADDARARGHEGVMVKNLAAPYAAGRRGSAWLKVKTARTLDLVVLAPSGDRVDERVG